MGAGVDADGVNDGLRPLLTADFSGASVSAGAPGVSAFTVWPAALAFALPMVSAGSGAAVPDVVSVVYLAAVASSPAGASPLAPPPR